MTDLTGVQRIEMHRFPGTQWLSVTAYMSDGTVHSLFTSSDIQYARHWRDRMNAEIIQRGRSMKVDEETGNLVVDRD